MKEKFKPAITLIELLVVISLVSLIFGLGLYPVLTQIKLFNAEKNELALFDEANLSVAYISRDAMRAKSYSVVMSPEAGENALGTLTLTIIDNPVLMNEEEVIYEWDSAQPEILKRTTEDGTLVVTNKLNPSAYPVVTPPSQPNLLHIELDFQDPDNSNITTKRRIDVTLRCRSAQSPTA